MWFITCAISVLYIEAKAKAKAFVSCETNDSKSIANSTHTTSNWLASFGWIWYPSNNSVHDRYAWIAIKIKQYIINEGRAWEQKSIV
jgi:hypothetical protein